MYTLSKTEETSLLNKIADSLITKDIPTVKQCLKDTLIYLVDEEDASQTEKDASLKDIDTFFTEYDKFTTLSHWITMLTDFSGKYNSKLNICISADATNLVLHTLSPKLHDEIENMSTEEKDKSLMNTILNMKNIDTPMTEEEKTQWCADFAKNMQNMCMQCEAI